MDGSGNGRPSGIVRELVVPVGSLIIAFAGIMLSFYSITTQRWLQQAQLKYRGYGALMGELRMACDPAAADTPRAMWDHVNKAWVEYYPLETFVAVDARRDLRKSFIGVVQACEEAQHAHGDVPALEAALGVFESRHGVLGEELEAALDLRRR